MFGKNKSRLCGLIMFAALLLSSCSQNENTGTVTFTISQEVAEKITAGSARTVTYSGASESEIFMDIVLQSNGDYNEMATVKVAKGSSAEFKAVPANLTVYIEAKAYKLEKRSSNSQLRTDLYEGKSSEIIVQGGENNLVSITLIKLPVDDSEPQETPTPAKEDTTKKDDTSNNQTNNPTESGSATDNSGSGTTESSTSGGNTENTGATETSGTTESGGSTETGSTGEGTGTSSGSITSSKVTFHVHYFKQNLEGDNYTEVTADEKTLESDSGSITQAGAKNYTGFTLENVTLNTNTQDGTTEANFYYNRNTHRVYYEAGANAEDVPAILQYRYGATVSVEVTNPPTRTGYTFNGWKNGNTTYKSGGTTTFVMGDDDVTLNAIWVREGSSTTIDMSVNANTSEITVVKDLDIDSGILTFTINTTERTYNTNNISWTIDGSTIDKTEDNASWSDVAYISNDKSTLYVKAYQYQDGPGVYDIVLFASDNDGNDYSYHSQMNIKDIEVTKETDPNNSNLIILKITSDRTFDSISWIGNDPGIITSTDSTDEYYLSSDSKWLYINATNYPYYVSLMAVDDSGAISFYMIELTAN